MSEMEAYREVARAVNDLRAATSAPQFIQTQDFELHGREETLNVFIGGTPYAFAGMEVYIDNTVPPNEVWVVEPRSEQHVTIKVRE